MSNRNAQGSGNIRKKTITRNGQTYNYWEARITLGKDPGTGKQIQKSFTGKTQKEVREKLQAAAVAVNNGVYQEPTKITVSEWLDIWASEYLGSVKPRTVDSYKATIKNHLKPALGSIKLQALTAPTIQKFYNGLQKHGCSVPKHDKDGKVVKKDGKTVYEKAPMSPKSIKNVHGILHKALQQATEIGYIPFNPADVCKLPRIERAEIKPLDSDAISAFLTAAKGHKFENVYVVTLFTGMREGEVLGLTWDCIDFKAGTINICRQLQKERGGDGTYHLVSPKNGKGRRITPAQSVMDVLKRQRRQQMEWQAASCGIWNNPLNLVFTNELGHNLSAQTVYLHFKKIAEGIDLPDARFHDLRHSYAVAALQSGDDIKTVQETLGHHTAAFTLDVYGHVTEQMKRESADRMEQFINTVKQA